MKNIYFLMMGLIAFSAFSQSQFTLTKLGQEPAIGDVHNTQGYDSVGTIPKSTGQNQNWNFTSVTQNTNMTTETYTTPASVPSSSLFPGATLVSDDGNGLYNFFKSSSSPTAKFEQMGDMDTSNPPATGTSYTSNPELIYEWPIAPGDNFTDSFAGTGIGNTGTSAGTSTTTSTGSGTITLPNGATYSNIVQLKTTVKETASISFSFISITYTLSGTAYQYFHPSQKFPLLTVSYFIFFDGTDSISDYSINANALITVGLKDQVLTKSFSIFPNPTKDNINLKIDNLSNEPCSIEIFDLKGQGVLNKQLGNPTKVNEMIDLSSLEKGNYILKTTLGTNSQSTKLIVE